MANGKNDILSILKSAGLGGGMGLMNDFGVSKYTPFNMLQKSGLPVGGLMGMLGDGGLGGLGGLSGLGLLGSLFKK